MQTVLQDSLSETRVNMPGIKQVCFCSRVKDIESVLDARFILLTNGQALFHNTLLNPLITASWISKRRDLKAVSKCLHDQTQLNIIN
jgi:hypothetical protein